MTSLLFPTFCSNIQCPDYFDGLFSLLFGWLGALFYGGIYWTWIANPFFIIALIRFDKNVPFSFVLSALALIISINFLNGGKVILNEAGNWGYVAKLESGYWLWLCSISILFVATLLNLIRWINNTGSDDFSKR